MQKRFFYNRLHRRSSISISSQSLKRLNMVLLCLFNIMIIIKCEVLRNFFNSSSGLNLRKSNFFLMFWGIQSVTYLVKSSNSFFDHLFFLFCILRDWSCLYSALLFISFWKFLVNINRLIYFDTLLSWNDACWLWLIIHLLFDDIQHMTNIGACAHFSVNSVMPEYRFWNVNVVERKSVLLFDLFFSKIKSDLMLYFSIWLTSCFTFFFWNERSWFKILFDCIHQFIFLSEPPFAFFKIPEV